MKSREPTAAARRPRTAFVPRVVYRTVFAGVIPACVALGTVGAVGCGATVANDGFTAHDVTSEASVADRGFGVADRGFVGGDVAASGFDVRDSGFSVADVGFAVADAGFSVADVGFDGG